MWWTQHLVFVSILFNFQDAQSESQGLKEYLNTGLRQEIDKMVSNCDLIKSNKNMKHEWTTLVTLATSKTIQKLKDLLSKEAGTLQKFSNEKDVVEYFQHSGVLKEFEKDLAQTYTALETFCKLKTGPNIAPRSLSSVGAAVEEFAEKTFSEVVAGIKRVGRGVGNFFEHIDDVLG